MSRPLPIATPFIARPWGELVLHVLAHVAPRPGLRGSPYEPRYVAFCERALGPASGRTLGQDAASLADLLPDGAILERAQALALLFSSVDRARACEGRDLAELGPMDVDRPELLPVVNSAGPSAELLFSASLGERRAHAMLPSTEADEGQLAAEIARASLAAPGLIGRGVALLRPLCHRGRAAGGEVWVGAPTAELGPSPAYVAWQAALQASVLEAEGAARARGLSLDALGLEHLASELLARRADAVGLTADHRAFAAEAPPTPRTLGRAQLESLLLAAGSLRP